MNTREHVEEIIPNEHTYLLNEQKQSIIFTKKISQTLSDQLNNWISSPGYNNTISKDVANIIYHYLPPHTQELLESKLPNNIFNPGELTTCNNCCHNLCCNCAIKVSECMCDASENAGRLFCNRCITPIYTPTVFIILCTSISNPIYSGISATLLACVPWLSGRQIDNERYRRTFYNAFPSAFQAFFPSTFQAEYDNTDRMYNEYIDARPVGESISSATQRFFHNRPRLIDIAIDKATDKAIAKVDRDIIAERKRERDRELEREHKQAYYHPRL